MTLSRPTVWCSSKQQRLLWISVKWKGKDERRKARTVLYFWLLFICCGESAAIYLFTTQCLHQLGLGGAGGGARSQEHSPGFPRGWPQLSPPPPRSALMGNQTRLLHCSMWASLPVFQVPSQPVQTQLLFLKIFFIGIITLFFVIFKVTSRIHYSLGLGSKTKEAL